MKEYAEGDIRQVKVPLPFPLRWVNSYLVKGKNGYTLIDPGLHTREAEELWVNTLEQTGVQLQDIEQIVLTHHHPDHYGVAGWFSERSGAPVWMAAAGWEQAKLLWGPGQPLSESICRLFVQNGMRDGLEQQMMPHLDSFIPLVSPQPGQVHLIEPGMLFRIGDRSCETIHTPGHAYGHICFYDRDRREMFCGDHVLPQISPNISYIPGIDENPLQSFLESLREIGAYRVERAFPGHREPFAPFGQRAAELIVHHEERLALMLDKVRNEPLDAYSLCLAVFGHRLTVHQLRFAMSETLAHLIYLQRQGRVSESERDGVVVYAAV